MSARIIGRIVSAHWRKGRDDPNWLGEAKRAICLGQTSEFARLRLRLAEADGLKDSLHGAAWLK